MLDLLKTHFGYDQFRPLQEEIIKTVLNDEDSLVLMPTGGGKSLCYQLPSLKFDGVTLVISPLIALMKDQVDALKANGVTAEFINSSLSYEEINEIQRQTQQGKVNLLYVAPERLARPNFQIFLKTLKVSLLAIDEAHCISEWGHDFRPDYCNLKVLRQNFPQVPVMALTATATKKVREDIINQLSLQKAKLFISSFNRPNLHYHIQPKRRTFDKLIKLLEKYKDKPTIIYCFSRKESEALATDLNEEGFSALPYHAGLDDLVRKRTQEKFIHDEVPIITATIAFGMGIDKPDIRLIVHYSLPKSIEGYYQETGRAGRDSLSSECVLFYSYGDKIKQDFFIDQIEDEIEKKNSQEKLNQMIDFCEGQVCRRKFLLEYFGEKQEKENCQGCDLCLTPAEKFDATIIVQKILSAVIRTGEMFGASYIIKILRGSKVSKIQERNHHKLSVYGIVDDFSEMGLQQVIRQLVAGGLLIKKDGDYPTLSVSNVGRKFLKERKKIVLIKPREESGRAVGKSHRESIEYDQELFEKLRVLRKRIANQRGVPPFIIFGDVALQEMAFYFPQSLESFANISGVGKEKLSQFGEIFLSAIKPYVMEHGLSEKPILTRSRRSSKQRSVKRAGSTCDETKKLIEQKLSLADIAKQRGLVEDTVISHIEKIIESGQELNIDYLKPTGERFEKIKQAFQKSGNIALAPVRNMLGENYSYKEIRLGRLFL